MSVNSIAKEVLHHVKNNQRDSALSKIKILIGLGTDLENVWGALARISLNLGDYISSRTCALNYLAVSPKEEQRLLQVAGLLSEGGHIQEAVKLIKTYNKNSANLSVSFLHFLGTAYSQLGNNDLATSYLYKALKMQPNLGITWLTLAAIIKFSPNDKNMKELERLKPQMSGSNMQMDVPYWYAYAKALLDCKDYNNAFSAYTTGSKLIPPSNNYMPSSHKRMIDNIISHQDKDYFEQVSTSTTKFKYKAIFIVGPPRSGTTLLQQILSAHPAIGEGGEIDAFSIGVNQFGIAQLSKIRHKNSETQEKTFNKISEIYQQIVKSKYSNSQISIDKTNNLNHYVGFISRVFPDASIIRIKRNVETTAWSCFNTFFSHGQDWSYSLENIAHYLKNEERLAAHWKALFGNKICEVEYENLVTDPRKEVLKLTQYLQIGFEESMLEFYKHKNIIQTASTAQARQPINTNSVELHSAIASNMKPFFDTYYSASL
jgi:tetratricopeptide (TPR) repeat protein